jgi:DNA-binding NarL/FixJ family response regulator
MDNRFARTLIKNALYAFDASACSRLRMPWKGPNTLRKEQIDVVLVDCQMPEITGVEFTLQVRKGGEIPNPEILIIMISGYTHDAKPLSPSQAGIHEFVSKSFSFNSFFRRIETTFTHPRQFIRSEDYARPDCRWLNINTPVAPERRNADEGRVAQSAGRAVAIPALA